MSTRGSEFDKENLKFLSLILPIGFFFTGVLVKIDNGPDYVAGTFLITVAMVLSYLFLCKNYVFRENKVGTRQYTIFSTIFGATFTAQMILVATVPITHTDTFGIIGRFLGSQIHNHYVLLIAIGVVLELWLLIPSIVAIYITRALRGRIDPFALDRRSVNRFRRENI